MEKCQKRDRLYNAVTKRCYKSCEQKNKNNDILLDYLLKSQAHLKTKPQKVFQDGGKKHKFILPKANPKASPVQF